MYYERSLNSKESLFVSRAQQKISDLGVSISEELSRNDVTFKDVQLSVELQHAVGNITSTVLDWTADEIEMVIDYYTVHADMADYAFIGINPMPSQAISVEVWATVQQLNAVDSASRARDAELEAELQAEIDRVEAESIQRDQDLASLITVPSTTKEITSEIKQGGVDIGEAFPASTKLEDIIEKMLKVEADTSDLSHTTHFDMLEVGSLLQVTGFNWVVVGEPEGLKISDTDSRIVKQSVSGSSYIPLSVISYSTAVNKDINWTLEGDNVETISLLTKIRYRSYYGKKTVTNDDPITVTGVDILASSGISGYNKLVDTDESISFTADTTNSQMGWIAVPKNQTMGDYVTWYVDDMNTAKIGADQFILTPVDVAVNGVTYSVYRWRYRSPLTEKITLRK